MATYFTKDEARLASKQRPQRMHKSAATLLNESVASVRDTDTFDVFLSHSIKDAELVEGTKAILEARGLKVYVDWIIDQQLDREKVTPETADVLRKRMSQSLSMIYIATDNASSSKWMPWELGYFDGSKPGQVAILPLVDNSTQTFRSQEYLGLYPVVRKDTYESGAPDVFVESIGTRWATLDRFAKGNTVWSKYK